MLKKYEVGELVDNEHSVFPKPGYVYWLVYGDRSITITNMNVGLNFVHTLKKLAEKYFEENNMVSCVCIAMYCE